MKTRRSLTRELGIFIVGQALFLVAVYSALLPFFYGRGLVESAGLFLELEASDYDRRRSVDVNTPLPATTSLKSYIGLESVPPEMLELFPVHHHDDGEALSTGRIVDKHSKHYGDLFIFFRHKLSDGQRLYMVRHIASERLDSHARLTRLGRIELAVVLVGAGVLFMWIVTTAWIVWRISGRANLLMQWMRQMGVDEVCAPRPDFGYREFDEIADQSQDAFDRIAGAIEREHSFLRNASHELRTPLTIIASNVELLKRADAPRVAGEAVNRISRAAISMQLLTETLLWLNRDDSEISESRQAPLDRIVGELLEDNAYLLDGKDVRIDYQAKTESPEVPEAPCRIALGNLIRNAFQYTDSGEIEVDTSDTEFRIRNCNDDNISVADSRDVEQGHGLGLLLVQKIVDRMGWTMHLRQIPGGRESTIEFGAS